MLETRLFFMVLTPDEMGHQRFYAPVMFHDEGFIKQQGEGWIPVSHTMTPTEGGAVLLTIMCNREVEIPDAGIAADE
ncbi:hypothetical protein ACXR2W_00760 [Leucobacter sp. HY1908]